MTAAAEGRKVVVRGQVGTLLLGRALAAALAAAWLLVAARLLSISEFGHLALLLAVTLAVGVVTDAGMTLHAADRVAAEPRHAGQVLRQTIRRRLVLAAPASVLLVAASMLASDEGDLLPPILFACSMAATAVHSSAGAVARGLGRARGDAANEVLSRLFVLVVGSSLLAAGGGVRAAAGAYVAADVASAVGLTWWVRRQAPPPSGSDVAPTGAAPSAGLALAAATVLGTVLYRIDAWMLGLLAGDAVVGVYAAAYRLLDGVLLPATAAAAIAVPALRWGGNGAAPGASASPHHVLLRMAAAASAGTAALAALAFAATPNLLDLLLGDRYRTGGDVLRILLLSAPASGALLVLLPRMMLERRAFSAWLLAAGVIANVLGNLWAVPRSGAVGAAVVTVLTQYALLVVALATAAPAGGRARTGRARAPGARP